MIDTAAGTIRSKEEELETFVVQDDLFNKNNSSKVYTK